MSHVFERKEKFLKAIYERPVPLSPLESCPGYVFNVIGRHVASISEERFLTKAENQLKQGKPLSDKQYNQLVSVRFYILQRYFDYLLARRIQRVSSLADRLTRDILSNGANVTAAQREEMANICKKQAFPDNPYTLEAVCLADYHPLATNPS